MVALIRVSRGGGATHLTDLSHCPLGHYIDVRNIPIIRLGAEDNEEGCYKCPVCGVLFDMPDSVTH